MSDIYTKYSVTLRWPDGGSEEMPFDTVTDNGDGTFVFHWIAVSGANETKLVRNSTTMASDESVWRAYIAEHVDPADVTR